MLVGGSNAVLLDNANNEYFSLISQTSPSETSTNNTTTVVCGGTLSSFSVTISGSPGEGNEYLFTLRVNNAGTNINCTITGAGTTCTDTSGTTSIVLSPGDVVNVESNPNSTPTARSATVNSSYARAGPL